MAESEIRVSDEERDAAVRTLGVHLSTGRLDVAEFEQRCEQVVAVRTRGELEALFTDLPAPHPDLGAAAPARREPGELAKPPAAAALEAVAGITFVFGIPGAILLTIFLGQWWVFVPVGIVFLVAAATADALKKRP
jgi:hypothetical protein